MQEAESVMVDNSPRRTSARVRELARERMERTGEQYTAALAGVLDGTPEPWPTILAGVAAEQWINEVDYPTARWEIATLGVVESRVYKLVGGDDGGVRNALFSDHPHTAISSKFVDRSSRWTDPPGWNVHIWVGGRELLKRNFPGVPYSQDDVPARAALHALVVFYWTALTETNPRWKTKKGALRFLKPGKDAVDAEASLRWDVDRLLQCWERLERYARGPIDDGEQGDILRIRKEFGPPMRIDDR